MNYSGDMIVEWFEPSSVVNPLGPNCSIHCIMRAGAQCTMGGLGRMKIEVPSDEERRKATIVYIGSRKTPPTIAELKHKRLVKNNREFYRLFKGGIREACEQAHVPPPINRLATVKAALTKRNEMQATASVQTPTTAQQDSSTTNPALKEVLADESEVTKLQETLDLARRKESAKQKKSGLERQIQVIEDKQVAKEMLHDELEFKNAMQRYYQAHPNLQAQVMGLFNRTGRAAEFDKNLNSVIADQFELTNRNAKIFPEVYSRAAETPTGESFASDQWDLILEELKDTADTEDYTQFDTALARLKPGPCPTHRTRLTHAGGYQFNCPHGHWVSYRCHRCSSPLNYDGARFHCPASLHKFTGV